MRNINRLKVAIVHDWLVAQRGGEKVLEAICELFPLGDIFTIYYDEDTITPLIHTKKITSSFIQKLPFAKPHFRFYLPLFPSAIEQFNLTEYDLVISTSHCVAKGIITDPDTIHICYCHTPIRYVWNFQEEYFGKFLDNRLTRKLLDLLLGYLRNWDKESAFRVDVFIANSKNIARKIRKYYGRKSIVIYPPIESDFFNLNAESKNGDFFLVVSSLVPYKRVDLAIEAFNHLGYKLKVVGDGPLRLGLQQMAAANIDFLGWVEKNTLRELYQNCRALIHPHEEDFGITAVEVQACGKPVIAFAAGGAMETVIDNITGVFFRKQQKESLIAAIEKYEKLSFDKHIIRKNALRFNNKNKFKNSINLLVQKNIGTTFVKPRYVGRAKRLFDIFFSAFALLVLLPFFPLIAGLIKLDSPGPAIYKQTRLGKSNKEFTLYKFRTMFEGSEPNYPIWSKKEDERITRLGKVLRTSNLDELPQLYNVLKGEMSIVGPRPERPFFVRIFSKHYPDYAKRTLVKPGITGLAQANGFYGASSIRQRLQYDLEYIRRQSLRFDMKILFMTAKLLIRHLGSNVQ